MLGVHRIVTGSLRENSYVVSHRGGDAVAIDPGGAVEGIAAHIAAEGLRLRGVLATHGHDDHVAAVAAIGEQYGAPFHLHPADEKLLQRANLYRTLFRGEEAIRIPEIDVPLEDRSTLRFGALEIDVIHTPGHTPGSVCFEVEGELFTGDLVLAGQPGETDLPGEDRAARAASVIALAERYPDDTRLHPGHGEPIRLGDALPVGALHELDR